jgi:hypothetical protein
VADRSRFIEHEGLLMADRSRFIADRSRRIGDDVLFVGQAPAFIVDSMWCVTDDPCGEGDRQGRQRRQDQRE